MQRDLFGPLVIALLCVVAIAVASATLTDPVTTTGPDRDVGTPDGGDSGWDPLRLNLSNPNRDSDGGGGSASLGPLCLQVLKTLEAKLLILLLLGLFSYELYRKMGSIGVAAGLAAVLPPGFILYTYLTACRPPGTEGGGWSFFQGDVTNNSSVSVGSGGAGGGAAVDPPYAILLVAGVLAVLLLVAFVRSTGDDAEAEEPVEPEPEPEEPDLAEVASVAGEAADRIEGPADVENEVFRAWREMTALLDVDAPESSTPAEFEAAALDAGMDPDAVATLTGVFRDVRYGGRAATPDREERAVDALRAIEAAHGEEVSA